MDNQTAVGLLSLCAFVAVMILLGSFLVIRILRTSIFGIASMVLRAVTDPLSSKEVVNAKAQVVHHTDHRDLHAVAKSVDFDAAVASKKGEMAPSVITTPGTNPPPLNASAFSTTETTTVTPLSTRKRRRRITSEQIDDGDDGEMFEGLLGE